MALPTTGDLIILLIISPFPLVLYPPGVFDAFYVYFSEYGDYSSDNLLYNFRYGHHFVSLFPLSSVHYTRNMSVMHFLDLYYENGYHSGRL